MKNIPLDEQLPFLDRPVLLMPKATVDSLFLADRQKAFATQMPKLLNEVKAAFIFGNSSIVSETIVKMKKIANELEVYELNDMLIALQHAVHINDAAQKIEIGIVSLDSVLNLGILDLRNIQAKIPA